MANASDYMTREVVALAPETSVHEAMRRLLASGISGAPVVDSRGDVVGMLTGRDIIGAIFEASYHKDLGGPVTDYMSGDVQTVDAGTDLMEVIEIFMKSPYRRFPVLSGTRLVGVISRRDVLRAIEELW